MGTLSVTVYASDETGQQGSASASAAINDTQPGGWILPTDANTGPRYAATRTINGDYRPGNGETLERAYVTGLIHLEDCSGVTLRDVTADGGLNVFTSEDTMIDHVRVGVQTTVASSLRTTYQWCDVHGDGDGMHFTSDHGYLIEDLHVLHCQVHAFHDIAPDAHVDGIQVRGIRRLDVRGSRVYWGQDPRGNAAFMNEDANGGCYDIVLEHNWLSGFGFTVRIGYVEGIEMRDNILGYDGPPFWGPFTREGYSGPIVQSGNVLADGTPITF